MEFLGGERIEFGAEFGRGCGERRGSVGEKFEVEAGASDDDGCAASGCDVGDGGRGEGGVALSVVWLGGIKNAEEVMRGEDALLRGWRGGEGVETVVELAGVSVDDFAIVLGGKLESKLGFARGRGAADVNGGHGRVSDKN